MENIGINDRQEDRTFEWKVPRISWGIFAVISFITTARGMSETFFDGDWLGGIAISVGIQLLLIWMNRKVTKMFVMVKKTILRVLIVLVYAVTVFWSAGFSYVYISNHVYSSIFMRDDQEKLVENYQRDIIALSNLAEEDFFDTLEMAIREVESLQAGTIPAVKPQVGGDIMYIEDLKTAFTRDAEMTQIIDEIEKVMNGEKIIITENMMKKVEDKIDEKEKEHSKKSNEISEKDRRITELDDKIMELAGEQYKYKSGTAMDITLREQREDYKMEREECSNDKDILEQEKKVLEKIVGDLKALKSCLSRLKNSPEMVTSSNFAQILTLIGQREPNIDEVERLVDETFVALSREMETGQNNEVYVEKMRAYLNLKEYLVKLQVIHTIKDYCKDAQRESVIDNTEKMVVSYPQKEILLDWRNQWNKAYGEIKSNFYLLPSAIKPEVIETCNQIAWLQRSLLTELNGVERGVYYLTCSHSLLARLAFLLALFLDSSAMVFMIVRAELEKMQKSGEVSGRLVIG